MICSKWKLGLINLCSNIFLDEFKSLPYLDLDFKTNYYKDGLNPEVINYTSSFLFLFFWDNYCDSNSNLLFDRTYRCICVHFIKEDSKQKINSFGTNYICTKPGKKTGSGSGPNRVRFSWRHQKSGLEVPGSGLTRF